MEFKASESSGQHQPELWEIRHSRGLYPLARRAVTFLSDMRESCSPDLPNSKPLPSPINEPCSLPPNLGPMVSTELEAVRNDLEQAKTLADDYRWQLAG